MDLTSLSLKWSNPEGVDQASFLLTLKDDDGRTIETVSTNSPQHSFKKLQMGKRHSITLSTVVKGFQRQSIIKTIRTSKWNEIHCNVYYILMSVYIRWVVGDQFWWSVYYDQCELVNTKSFCCIWVVQVTSESPVSSVSVLAADLWQSQW